MKKKIGDITTFLESDSNIEYVSIITEYDYSNKRIGFRMFDMSSNPLIHVFPRYKFSKKEGETWHLKIL